MSWAFSLVCRVEFAQHAVGVDEELAASPQAGGAPPAVNDGGVVLVTMRLPLLRMGLGSDQAYTPAQRALAQSAGSHAAVEAMILRRGGLEAVDSSRCFVDVR